MRNRASWSGTRGNSSEVSPLDGDRVLFYSAAVIFLYFYLILYAYWHRLWFLDSEGFPKPVDFVSFWAAGFLARSGDAAAAYDWDLHKQASILAIGRAFSEYYPWHYPPTFLFIATPLSCLPYLHAWFIWIGSSVVFFLASLRLYLPTFYILVGLAAPASLSCVLVGQNGFLTAGLFSAALALLDRAPWAAGFFVGFLTYKPHFGILFPLFLIMGRHWKTFAIAALTSLILATGSMIAFGWDAWISFISSISVTTNAGLLRENDSLYKLQSFYSLFYQMTGNSTLSFLAHAGVALGVCAVVVRIWMRPASPAVKSAAFVTASFLVSPYAYIYDAVLLVVAAAFLLRDGLEHGFEAQEKILLVMAFAMPALFHLLGSATSLISCLMLLYISIRRSRVNTFQEHPAI